MTERDLGHSFSWWVGKVVNVADAPDQDGRVRVRIFGRHDDETNIKDEDLPWALPMQDITSAAIGKVGTSPLGLLVGSRVMGYYIDKDQQQPVIMGSFGKAGDPKGSATTAGGTEQIDITTGSIPTPSINQSDPQENNPYSVRTPDRISIDEVNRNKKDISKTSTKKGVKVREDVDKDLPKHDTPTTASADKNDASEVLDVLKKVDPSNASGMLKNAVDKYINIRNIMNMTSPAGVTNMMSGALGGAMSELAANLGVDNLLAPMSQLLGSNLLSDIAQKALQTAMASVMKSTLQNNGRPALNVISNIIPEIDPLGAVPAIIMDILDIPETYVQQYYPLESEPYPGYIEWVDSDTGDIIYSLRGTEPHYPSAIDAVIGHNAAALTSNIGKILGATAVGAAIGVAGDVAANLLDEAGLSDLANTLESSLGNIQAMGISAVLGKGVNLGSIMGLASKLLPNIAAPLNQVMSGHLPDSFLNVGSVSKSLSNFTKNQALLKMKKKAMEAALDNSDEESDQQFKDYIKAKVQADAANAPAGSTVSASTTLSNGSTYTYSVKT